MSERFLLDTSAIFAFTDGEEGCEVVEELFDRATEGRSRLLGCSMSLMEIYYVTLQEQGDDDAARLFNAVKHWPLRWIHPSEETLLVGGRIKAQHRLSFADALIAATTWLADATLVHKDPEFDALEGELAVLALPYKR